MLRKDLIEKGMNNQRYEGSGLLEEGIASINALNVLGMIEKQHDVDSVPRIC